MSVAKKTFDNMKTTGGKAFAILVALSLVLGLSSIAYGVEDPDLVAKASESALADETDVDNGTVADGGADDQVENPGNAGGNGTGSSDQSVGGTEGESGNATNIPNATQPNVTQEQEVTQTPQVTKTTKVASENAAITFGLIDGSAATVTTTANGPLALGTAIEYAPTAPYEFRVVPAEGQQIVSVKMLSTPTVNRVTEVPTETKITTVTTTTTTVEETKVVETVVTTVPNADIAPAAVEEPQALSDDATIALAAETDAAEATEATEASKTPETTPADPAEQTTASDEDEATDTSDVPETDGIINEVTTLSSEVELKPVNTEKDALDPFAYTYRIELADLITDKTGHDVTIEITTEEMKFDAWWKVVEAFEAGRNVKLDAGTSAGTLVVGNLPEGDATELTAWQLADNNKQAVVAKGDITLDLNGVRVMVSNALDGASDSLIKVTGGSLAIKDAASAHLTPTGSSKGSGTLVSGGSPNTALAGNAAVVTDDQVTYYVTTSDPIGNGKTAETLYEQTIAIPTNAGRIINEAESIVNIVDVDEGSSATISGGVFTNTAGHAVQIYGALTMDGGMIFGCHSGDLDQLGGGLLLGHGSTGVVTGNAVIAGNTVTRSNTCGGGVYAAGESFEISGDAVVAGNSSETNGGGVYVSCDNFTVSGNAVIASNQARLNGGGIGITYRNNTTISGNATITNNRTTEAYEGADNQNWHNATLGGGGIHVEGVSSLTLSGGRITANYSADGGGGILMPNTSCSFNMGFGAGYDAIVASNYAAGSEGGGMYLMPAAGSKITAGYITNNATGTQWDFGGGGLYVGNEAKDVEVWHPVVTGNVAAGYGGGVANCQNGMTVSDKAAIYGNEAKGSSLSNTTVEVDHWIQTLGIPAEATDDFVGGKRSEIYSTMLGGGTYGWTGYMSYQPTQETTVSMSQEGWGKGTIKVGGTTVAQGANLGGITEQPGYYQLTAKMTASQAATLAAALESASIDIYRTGKIEKTTGYSSAYPAYDNGATYEKRSDGYWYFAFNITPSGWEDTEYTTNIWSKRPTNTSDANDTEWAQRDRMYELASISDDGTKVYKPTTNGLKNTGLVLSAAKTNTGNNAVTVKWPIAQIESFPADGFAWTNRLMTLKASNPTSIAGALAEGNLFITGNYSSTNGGGIANNGNIVIGEDPDKPFIEEEPTVEYDQNGSLVISKTYQGIDAANYGAAIATFSVAQYASPQAYSAGVALKEDIVTFQFTADGTQEYAWPNQVRAGNIFVIQEIGIEGDNASDASVAGNTQVIEVGYVEVSDTVTAEDGTVTTVTKFAPLAAASFSNAFAPESYMTSVINKYKEGAFTQVYSRSTSTGSATEQPQA